MKVSKPPKTFGAKKNAATGELGGWHVKLGTLVRVIIGMKTRDVRYHVALVDKLPGGLEIVNSGLRGMMGSLPERAYAAEPQSHSENWIVHRNLRDERAEAFGFYVSVGDWGFSYFARATSKGVFRIPPTQAYEMYAPEVFGRSESEEMTIEA